MTAALLAPRVSASFAAALSDDELLELQRSLAESRRLIDADASVVAAEVAHRSRRELGYDGLAQQRGARTPEKLLQQITGLSAGDARTLVRVGTMTPSLPWLSDASAAVSRGQLSLDAADVIRAGIGSPSSAVTAGALAGLVTRLVIEASQLTLERLAARARELRDELDEAAVIDREAERRDRRFLSLTPLADGMTRLSGLLDPESAAIVSGAIDAATSPRRGGPRFVDQAEAERGPTPPGSDESRSDLAAVGVGSQRLLDDERSIPQLALDSLVELVRIATLADAKTVLGAGRVAIRVHVAERDLQRGVGLARMEGQTDAVSVATAERLACDSGFIPVMFDDDGQVINVGRQQRTFTPRQRVALAARDGGCRVDGCDRPPAWTEAHHVVPWSEGGCTDLENGILLCRHHHLLLHNNGWQIIRDGAEYWMLPPATAGVGREPIPMPPKHTVRRT